MNELEQEIYNYARRVARRMFELHAQGTAPKSVPYPGVPGKTQFDTSPTSEATSYAISAARNAFPDADSRTVAVLARQGYQYEAMNLDGIAYALQRDHREPKPKLKALEYADRNPVEVAMELAPKEGDSFEDWGTKKLPAVGQVYAWGQNREHIQASENMQAGQATFRDYYAAAKAQKLDEFQANRSFGGKVFDVASEMPKFIGDIAMSGGLGRTATTAKTLTGHVAQRGMQIGTNAARLTVTQPGYVGEATTRRMKDEIELSPDEEGQLQVTLRDSGESILTALPKGFVDTYIEFASEQVGGDLTGALGKGFAKLPRSQRISAIKEGAARAWVKKFGSLNKFQEVLKQHGWDGILGEVLEERAGELARGVTGVEDHYGVSGQLASGDAEQMYAGLEQLAVEGLAFGAFGGGMGAVNYAANAPYRRERKQRMGELRDLRQYQQVPDQKQPHTETAAELVARNPDAAATLAVLAEMGVAPSRRQWRELMGNTKAEQPQRLAFAQEVLGLLQAEAGATESTEEEEEEQEDTSLSEAEQEFLGTQPAGVTELEPAEPAEPDMQLGEVQTTSPTTTADPNATGEVQIEDVEGGAATTPQNELAAVAEAEQLPPSTSTTPPTKQPGAWKIRIDEKGKTYTEAVDTSQPITRTDPQLEANLKKVFAGSTVTQAADDIWTLKLANGKQVMVQRDGELLRRVAQSDDYLRQVLMTYGMSDTRENRAALRTGANGAWVAFDTKDNEEDLSPFGALVLAEGLARTESQTLRHEAIHMARSLGTLTEQQFQKLWKQFAPDAKTAAQAEEAIAFSAQAWDGGLTDQLGKFFRDMATGLGLYDAETAKLRERIASGKMWENPAEQLPSDSSHIDTSQVEEPPAIQQPANPFADTDLADIEAEAGSVGGSAQPTPKNQPQKKKGSKPRGKLSEWAAKFANGVRAGDAKAIFTDAADALVKEDFQRLVTATVGPASIGASKAETLKNVLIRLDRLEVSTVQTDFDGTGTSPVHMITLSEEALAESGRKQGAKKKTLKEKAADARAAADDVWAEIAKKMRGKLPMNPLADAEMVGLASKVIALELKAGTYRFADFIAQSVAKLGTETTRKLGPIFEKQWKHFYDKHPDYLDAPGSTAAVVDAMETTDAGEVGVRELEEKPTGAGAAAAGAGERSAAGGNRGSGKGVSEAVRGESADGDDAAAGSGTRSDQSGDLGARPAGGNADERDGGDYRIADGEIGESFKPVERFNANVRAIETLQRIEAENRKATAAEQKILAQWVGWGGLAEAFAIKPKKDWEKRQAKLKELLSKEEYAAASSSTKNAHYTSPAIVRAMYKLLEQLNLNPRKILEPSMGNGNFFGLAPAWAREGVQRYGVELDSITGRIAKQLYQHADVRVQGFEEAHYPDNFFDLIVSNVPFGDYTITDSKERDLTGQTIHNYFFLKALKKARPGGIVAFITSRYTLDESDADFRIRLKASGGELLGAFRLPSTAFEDNARTSVVTDLIIIQKKPRDVDDDWSGATYRHRKELQLSSAKVTRRNPNFDEALGSQEGNRKWLPPATVDLPPAFPINEYYVQNRDHILGDLAWTGQMNVGKDQQIRNLNVDPRPGLDVARELAAGKLREPHSSIRPTENFGEEADAGEEVTGGNYAEGELVPHGSEDSFKQYRSGRLYNILLPEAQKLEDWNIAANAVQAGSYTTIAQMDVLPPLPVTGEQEQLYKEWNKVPKDERKTTDPRGDGEVQLLKRAARLIAGESSKEKIAGMNSADALKKYIAAEIAAKRKSQPKKIKVQHERARQVITVLRAVRKLKQLQRSVKATDEQVEAARAELRDAYNKVVKPHLKNPNYLFRSSMVDAIREDYVGLPEILALENYNKDTDTATLADIFTERTEYPYEAKKKADTPQKAFFQSLVEMGAVDTAYMSKLVGRELTDVEIATALGDQAYKNPDTGKWEPRQTYLSGPVRTKLRTAIQRADLEPEYERNVAALKAVQPRDKQLGEFRIEIAATWIPDAWKEQFVRETMELAMSVKYSRATGNYTTEVPDKDPETGEEQDTKKVKNSTTWGTERMLGTTLFAKALNYGTIKIYSKSLDGKSTYYDEKETEDAKEKQQLIREEFERWIARNHGEAVVKQYNEIVNDNVTPEFSGKHVVLHGMSETWKAKTASAARQYQKDTIWRAIQQRNLLLHHVVGAGKSVQMAGIIMESRRLGLAQKPVMVVPNHLLDQATREFSQAYPMAKILSTSSAETNTAVKRRRLYNRIQTGNWDVIIVTHSSFGKIGVSPAEATVFYEKQIEELRRELIEANNDNDKNYVKKLEAALTKLEQQLVKQQASWRKDPGPYFDQLGIDMIVVDEAHEFKNLFFRTKNSDIPGVDNQGSQKAFDLWMKTSFVNRTQGKVIFATGTPIANTPTEMYTVMRYLAPELLERMGMEQYDSWHANFARVEENAEFRPDGGGTRVHRRLAGFANIQELQKMYKSFADVKLAQDLTDVRRPKKNLVEVKIAKSPEMQRAIESMPDRMDAVRAAYKANRGYLPKGSDTPITILGDGRKMAVDMRLFDASLPDRHDSKINTAVRNVVDIWKRTAEDRLTQIIWLDTGVPQKKGRKRSEDDDAWSEEEGEAEVFKIDLYNDIKRKLIDAGVTPAEITFIHEADTEKRKSDLFRDMNTGKVRILIANTPKLGTGANVQRRLFAAHHLDAPYKPSELEQRDGRIWRPGNLLEPGEGAANGEGHLADKYGGVFIYRYLVQDSFDEFNWQLLERKAKFIEQLVRDSEGKQNVDWDMDPLEEMALARAAATGNKLESQRLLLNRDIRQLENQRRMFLDDQLAVAGKLKSLGFQAETKEKIAADYQKAFDAWQKSRESMDERTTFRITIAGKEFRDYTPDPTKEDKKPKKRAEATQALETAVTQAIAQRIQRFGPKYENRSTHDIGTVEGVKLSVELARTAGFDSQGNTVVTYNALKNFQLDGQELAAGEDMGGNVTRINNFMKRQESLAAEYRKEAAAARKELEQLQGAGGKNKEWPKAAELQAKQEELWEVEREYNATNTRRLRERQTISRILKVPAARLKFLDEKRAEELDKTMPIEEGGKKVPRAKGWTLLPAENDPASETPVDDLPESSQVDFAILEEARQYLDDTDRRDEAVRRKLEKNTGKRVVHEYQLSHAGNYREVDLPFFRFEDDSLVPATDVLAAVRDVDEDEQNATGDLAAGFFGGFNIRRDRGQQPDEVDPYRHTPEAPGEVENQLRGADGVPDKTLAQRWVEFKQMAVQATRANEWIPNNEDFAAANEWFRLLKSLPEVASDEASRRIMTMTDKLDVAQLKLFTRKVILDNLAAAVERGEPLRFGFKSLDEVQQYLAEIDAEVASHRNVQQALRTRKAIVTELVTDLVAAGLLQEDALERADTYYHQQVLDHLDFATAGARAKQLTKKSFQRARVQGEDLKELGSIYNYNTNFLEAESTWMRQALVQLELERALDKLNQIYGVADRFKAEAKQLNWLALVGGEAVAARIEQLRKLRKLDPKNERVKEELWRLDPTAPFRQQMAIAVAMLERHLDPQELTNKKLFFQAVSKLAKQEAGDEQNNIAARMYLKALRERDAFIKETLGSKFVTWQSLVEKDEQYALFEPDLTSPFYAAFTIREQLAGMLMEGMAQELKITPQDVSRQLVRANVKEWALPVEIVAQLTKLQHRRGEGYQSWIEDLSKNLLGKWKAWTLMRPMTAVGYNLRNMVGDAEAVVAGAPGVLKYTQQAITELSEYYGLLGRDPKASMPANLREARDLAVLDASFTSRDIPDVKKIKVFRRFYDNPQNLKEMLVDSYWQVVKEHTRFRENVLRYAAYLHFKAQLESGKLTHYGAANRKHVEAIRRDLGVNTAAAHLARNLLGDYGNLSTFGNYMRDHLIPFYSWMEINGKRWPRLAINAVTTGRGLTTAAVLTLRLGLVYGLLQLFNAVFFPDEEEELSREDRAQPHIIFGRDSHGNIILLRNVSALGDFLEWFGVNTIASRLPEVLAGQTDAGDIAGMIGSDLTNKVAQGIRPEIKGTAEFFGGQSYFPDVWNPRRVPRDELAADLAGVKDEYLGARGMVTGDGSRPRAGWWNRYYAGTSQPQANALREIWDLRDKYKESQGLPVAGGGHLADADMRRMRLAAYADDYQAFVEARTAYLDRNKTLKNFEQSLATLDPLSDLNGERQADFIHNYLSDDQRGRLDMARRAAADTRITMWQWWLKADADNATASAANEQIKDELVVGKVSTLARAKPLVRTEADKRKGISLAEKQAEWQRDVDKALAWLAERNIDAKQASRLYLRDQGDLTPGYLRAQQRLSKLTLP